jgi:hypothetical protein
MESLNLLLEDVIDKCGGFGRFQFTVVSVAMFSKAACTWGILMMQFGGATPDWWCQWTNNSEIISEANNQSSLVESYQTCSHPRNGSTPLHCSSVRFSNDKNTVVNEVIFTEKAFALNVISSTLKGLHHDFHWKIKKVYCQKC